MVFVVVLIILEKILSLMNLPDYEPPNDAVGFLIVLIVAISAGLSMKFVVDQLGNVGEVLVIPILFIAIAILVYISPD